LIVKEKNQEKNIVNSQKLKFKMPKDNTLKSVLIIGSGPIVIGQA
jgi:hypothetical protein